jgi:hypothetical protein
MMTNLYNALPTTQLGNVARVDSVYGNDSTAYIGGLPYLTVQAAISGVVGTGTTASPQYPNTTIWVLPGTYTVSPTATNQITDSSGNVTYAAIAMPTNTALRGLNIQTCTIQCAAPTGPTGATLLQMNTAVRVEDLTLTLGSSSYAGSNNLVGIYYGGSTSTTAKLRTCVLNVCNASMSYTSSNNVYGIQFDGTGSLGASTFSYNCVKGSTINVYTNGSGNKRGMIVTNTNIVTLRDTNIYIAGYPSATSNNAFTGSYVGVETNDPAQSGSIQLRTTTVGVVGPTGSQTYTASDILQTSPTAIVNPTYLASAGIQLGPGVDLVTKTAGGKGFSAYNYPTTLFYGLIGTMGSGSGANTTHLSGWLWPGTVVNTNQYPDQTSNASSYPAYYRAQQGFIACGLNVAVATSGTGASLTVTVYKNAIVTTGGVPSSSAGSLSVTLAIGSVGASIYTTSLNLAAGDRLSVYVTTTGSGWTDVSVQVDCF